MSTPSDFEYEFDPGASELTSEFEFESIEPEWAGEFPRYRRRPRPVRRFVLRPRPVVRRWIRPWPRPVDVVVERTWDEPPQEPEPEPMPDADPYAEPEEPAADMGQDEAFKAQRPCGCVCVASRFLGTAGVREPLSANIGIQNEKAGRNALSNQFNFQPEAFEYEAAAGEFTNAETSVAGPGLNRGSPDYIRWVQGSLNRIAGTRLAVDGIIGPLTRGAIRAFQQRNKLTADGIVGPRTEAMLIYRGGGAPSVQWVQRTLNQVMGSRLPEDGVMSVQTRSVMRSFEQRHGRRFSTPVAFAAIGVSQPFSPIFARNLLCMFACLVCVGSIPSPPPGDELFWCTLCINCGAIPHPEQ